MNKPIFFLVLLTASMLFSCVTPQVPEEEVVVIVEEPEEPETTEVVVEEPESVEEPEPYVPTEEQRVETFQRVDEVIADLNALIRAKDYEAWLQYLTEDYVVFYGSAEELDLNSQSERLKNNGIVLTSLEDYFRYVVVPSRANLRLDDLVFISETEVVAIMIVRDVRYTIYKLQYMNDQWKIAP